MYCCGIISKIGCRDIYFYKIYIMGDILKDLGINIGLSVAGFFGSLLLIGKTSAFDLRTTFTSIIAGVTSANYITPMVVDLLKIKGESYTFSIAFLMGFLGLRGVEVLSNKLLKNVNNGRNKSNS